MHVSNIAVPLAVAAVLAFSACKEEVPREAAPAPQRAKILAPHEAKWLDEDNPLTPAQWLASRGEAQARAPDDAKVIGIAADLKRAHRVYHEGERMIANRAVQLSDMLKSAGIEEDAADILRNLATVPADMSQTEGFGAIAQMYHNLRTSGSTRSEALVTLKKRYGKESPSE